MNREDFGTSVITMQQIMLELFSFSSRYVDETEVNFWHYFSLFWF